eukprot:Nk52_evm1s1593 gene=Nk52_evmTU1s1593
MNVNVEDNARDKLADWKQKTSVRAANMDFRLYMSLIPGPHNMADVIDRYKRGLKPMVRMEVEKALRVDTSRTEETLASIMSIAESIDELQYQFGRRLPGPQSTRLPPRGPTSGRGASDSTTVPMDLSNIETDDSNILHDQISEDHVSTGTGELNNVNAYR